MKFLFTFRLHNRQTIRIILLARDTDSHSMSRLEGLNRIQITVNMLNFTDSEPCNMAATLAHSFIAFRACIKFAPIDFRLFFHLTELAT